MTSQYYFYYGSHGALAYIVTSGISSCFFLFVSVNTHVQGKDKDGVEFTAIDDTK